MCVCVCVYKYIYIYIYIYIYSIQDVATSQILSAAKYKLDELMPSRVFGRVHRLVEGTHRVQFSMPGYVQRIITFSVGGGFDKGCEVPAY